VTAGHPNSHHTHQRRALLYFCRAQHGEQLQIHRWQVFVTQLISLRWLVFDTKAHLTGTTLPYLGTPAATVPLARLRTLRETRRDHCVGIADQHATGNVSTRKVTTLLCRSLAVFLGPGLILMPTWDAAFRLLWGASSRLTPECRFSCTQSASSPRVPDAHGSVDLFETTRETLEQIMFASYRRPCTCHLSPTHLIK
jgi:hypothetical protein